AHVAHPAARTEQLLEVQVADVSGVVVAGDGGERRLDAIEVRDRDLVFLPIPLVREIAGAQHQVGLELVQLDDHTVHQVRNEEWGANVQVGDVGDRCHNILSLRPVHQMLWHDGGVGVLDLLIIAWAVLAAVAGYRRGASIQIGEYAGLAAGLVAGALIAPTIASLASSPVARAALALAALFG